MAFEMQGAHSMHALTNVVHNVQHAPETKYFNHDVFK
jgi:hypothetical protein